MLRMWASGGSVLLAHYRQKWVSSGCAPTDESPRKSWVLLVRGRGFTRILRDEPLVSPSLLRTADPHLPRPMCFPSSRGAVGYAQSVGLIPHQASWRVRES